MDYDRVAREDLVSFLATATTDTGQAEFYGSAGVDIEFLHQYVQVNYRELYAGTLAVGTNDFHASLVIENLLAKPAESGEARRLEGKLIAARVRRMPPQRVWKVWVRLCRAGYGNRRLRAIVREWLHTRDVAFDAVKYRRWMWLVVRHLHLEVPVEVAEVLSGRWRHNYQGHTEGVLGAWQRAHFSDQAVFELPFTVAQGFAARRGISHEALLRRGRLTAAERVRFISSADRRGVAMGLDARSVALMPLVTYALSLPVSERLDRRVELEEGLQRAARRAVGSAAGSWGRVEAVLDDSYSSSGSSHHRQGPLIAAVAVAYALAVLADSVTIRWTSGRTDTLAATPRGATDLASPILDALNTRPDLLMVVSDGVDTHPPGAAGEVLRVWSACIADGTTMVMHVNPVSETWGPRILTPTVPTVGIRDAADLPLLRQVAQLATGQLTRTQLATWLATARATVAGAR